MCETIGTVSTSSINCLKLVFMLIEGHRLRDTQVKSLGINPNPDTWTGLFGRKQRTIICVKSELTKNDPPKSCNLK